MSSDDVDRAPPGRGSAPTTPPGATSEPWLRIGTPDLHELRQAHGRKIPLDAVSVQLYVEADLALGDGDRVVYEEPSFGIAELAGPAALAPGRSPARTSRWTRWTGRSSAW
ncbi:MAG: hypothetical protein IR158_12965 [Cellulomonas sp.]|uniref:hypothetical protein n=1 Tax=Cellulomonas sp. TaxID=40001 RepID=UPI0019E7F4D9|nr:hypothetical protein [Cellulomonas sp.]MBF0688660.1 hypothetical protein [Cellulomonas sp.]